MLITCNRCGKTLDIVNDGDGIHTCTPKQAKADYPWPIDKPIDDSMKLELCLCFGSAIPYLLDRLKIAEAPGVFTMRVNEALAELADRGLPEVCDLLRALERDNAKKAQRITELETQIQTLKYGEY